MADATYKVIGLSKKKGKPAETSDADYQIQYSPRGEKEKNPDRQKSDDYYDDRLSRDSQLDSHLKELVSDGIESTEMGRLVSRGFVPQEEDEQVADEFYEDADEGQDSGNQPADINIAGEIYTTAALKEMLGDWEGEDGSPPAKADQPRTNSPGQNASSVSSELLINISDRYEGGSASPNEGRKTPVEARLTAQLNYMQGQLNAALSQLAALEEMVTCQREFINQQQSWNTSMSAEAEQLNSRLVTIDAKADAAHMAAKLADSIARKSADTANRSLQASVSHQAQLKALDASMAQLNKTQQTLFQQAGGLADRQITSSAAPSADTFENSIFFGGVHAYRDRLGLHPQSDPIFVIS
jgi:hypothetical protein